VPPDGHIRIFRRHRILQLPDRGSSTRS
jgi:hypothetical protein